MYKSMFAIKDDVNSFNISSIGLKKENLKSLWATLGNCWQYIFNYVSCFASIMLNLSVLRDLYTVLILCIGLPNHNQIYSFLLELIVGSFLLEIFKKV